MIIINYLMIGVVYTLLIKKHPHLIKAYKELGYAERIVMIVIWPICVIVFIKAFWDTYK